MSDLTIRPLRAEDIPALRAVLNDIIAIGGTTANEEPFTDEGFAVEFGPGPETICCIVAVLNGAPIAFQHLGRYGADRPEWGYISSFAAPSAQGHGIGPQLFAQTAALAKDAGLLKINATIRADNVPGLRYYAKMGFVEYDRAVGVPLRDGTPVDRVKTVFTL
ncbi:L-amino acid N-acyltransferase YncA [Rubricella aquisinus]|uniref:L-amino acid N-acyltransferase YncA n=1 Tax=Rubricella aquisinus TaxID=2028108 RepID=A0A840WQA4_9RHOB|nr:GNAT family N-acetyltransferase [Rubricella aquisinus]MBB5515852.1 L-amino acid N-acyltransferase YncA [Rubricella aquisinus]